jgi:hypothetical protein
MARYQPDNSWQGYGDDYTNWGCKLIMDDDRCLHVGPNGEIMQGDRKNTAYEIERDNLQRLVYARMVRGNPSMWFYYFITKVVFKDAVPILQIEDAFRLFGDGSLKADPPLFKYPGNVYEYCKKFDAACRKAANDNRGGGRFVPDYGKKRAA